MKTITTTINGVETKVVTLEDHNSTVANVRKTATNGLIDPNSEEYLADKTALKGYKSKEFKNSTFNTFKTFNVNPEYNNDVFKVAGITEDMDEKAVKSTMTAFAKEPKNDIYFTKDNNQTINNQNNNQAGKPAASTSGGGSFWNRKG